MQVAITVKHNHNGNLWQFVLNYHSPYLFLSSSSLFSRCFILLVIIQFFLPSSDKFFSSWSGWMCLWKEGDKDKCDCLWHVLHSWFSINMIIIICWVKWLLTDCWDGIGGLFITFRRLRLWEGERGWSEEQRRFISLISWICYLNYNTPLLFHCIPFK